MNAAVFTRQWWRSDYPGGSPSNAIAGATNADYTLVKDDKFRYIGVSVTCVDGGVPGGASVTAWSTWQQETSSSPALVIFTNALNNGAWGSYSNWVPDDVPGTNTVVVVGDINVASPVTALIGASDAAGAKNLHIATNANAEGAVQMTGGTLTMPAAGVIRVGIGSSSTGTLNQTGGTLAGMTGGDVTIASGTGSKGTVLLGGNTAITSTWTVAGGGNSDGTFILTNSAKWKNNDFSVRVVGGAAGAIGRLAVGGSVGMDMYASGQPRSVTLGAGVGSTGEMTVVGNATVSNMAVLAVGEGGCGRLTVGGNSVIHATSGSGVPSCTIGGTNDSGEVTVKDNGILTGPFSVGARAGSVGTLVLTNNARGVYGTTAATTLGDAAGASGYLYVRDTAALDCNSGAARAMTVGNVAGGTGVVQVAEFGAISNVATLTVGSSGYGRMAVGGTGVVSAATVTLGASAGGYGNLMAGGTGVVKTTTLNVGSAGQGYLYMSNNTYMDVRDIYLGGAVGSNAYMEVADNAFITNSGSAIYGIQMGLTAGNVSILQLKGGSLITRTSNGGGMSGIGHAVGSTGIVTVTGGSHVLACGASSPGQDQYVGAATGSLGRIEVKGGNLAMTACWVIGRYGRGELLISGGGFTKPSGGSTEYLYLGGDRGGYGLIGVTGGTWNQAAPLYVGVIAGGTGEVSAANCVSTNITGAVTVGGAGYGRVTVSNATFGGGTAVTVTNAGTVELFGTGSVLRVNTLAVKDGGSVTNRVRQLAGGVDVTNSAITALAITNGGKMHLVFEGGPSILGDYWGLRWAGNMHAGQLQGLVSQGGLSWDDTALGGVVAIYTNATHTMIGYVVDQAGTIFRFR
jgi:hypothetical protein